MSRAAWWAVPALSLMWGLNWPAVRIALSGFSPWLLRAIGLGGGALLLFALARLRGQPLAVPRGQRVPLAVSALLTIAIFNVMTAFAQLAGSTSRAAIVTFTMPVWAVIFAWIFLGERPDRRRAQALALGIGGLGLLALPLFEHGASLTGVAFALAAGMSWAGGTVYAKRVPLRLPAYASCGWQLALSSLACVTGWLLSGHGVGPVAGFAAAAGTTVGAAGAWSWPWIIGALVFHVTLAIATAYVLWFDIVSRLPAATAALATLAIPVVGVASAMLFFGERPSLTDLVGFAAILGAAGMALRGISR